MAKRTITRFWIFGGVALAMAAVLIVADGVALADHLGARSIRGGQGLLPDDFSRTAMVLMILGGAVAAIGIVAELVAWVSALANTRLLSDRRWFSALLWSGVAGILTLPLFGLGVLIGGSATLAYVVGGPDRPANGRPQGASSATAPMVWSKPAIRRWSTWGLVPIAAGALIALMVSRETNPGGLLQGHTWTALLLLTTCFAVAAGGAVIEAACWWAAMFNARQLADRTWFSVLVWGAIVATLTMPLLGLGALIAAGVGIAYRQAAPDALAADNSPESGHAATA